MAPFGRQRQYLTSKQINAKESNFVIIPGRKSTPIFDHQEVFLDVYKLSKYILLQVSCLDAQSMMIIKGIAPSQF